MHIHHICCYSDNIIIYLYIVRYDRLHIHTHKNCSMLPDMPMPKHYPQFPSKKQYANYFKSYSILYNLNILFEHKVMKAKYNDGGYWDIIVRKNKDSKDTPIKGKILICCTGQENNEHPNIPTFKDQNVFKGQIIHSSKYKSPIKSLKINNIKTDKVLIVGAGNTGTELSIDLYEHGFNNIDILIRSPISIVRRHDVIVTTPFKNTVNSISDNIFDDDREPIDYIEADKQSRKLQNKHFSILTKYGIKLNQNIGIKGNKFGISSALAYKSIPPLLDIGFSELIKKEKVKVIPYEIESFYSNGCIFKNGLKKEYNIIILATGFKKNSTWKYFLDNKLHDIILNEYNCVDYGGIECKKQEKLYFIGFGEMGIQGRINEMNYESRQIMKDLVSKYL